MSVTPFKATKSVVMYKELDNLKAIRVSRTKRSNKTYIVTLSIVFVHTIVY